MSDVYLGQIIMAGFPFAPRGFALCDGQLMPIQTNQALFALLGVQYGGDGRTTFALPDLRGRVPVSAGISVDSAWQPPAQPVGTAAGAESITLLVGNIPPHTHGVLGVTSAGTVRNPTGATFAGTASNPKMYATQASPAVPQAGGSVGVSGSNQAHANMQPFGVINFFICIQGGLYPPRD